MPVTVSWNDSPTVYLRGPWYSSPYNEDGAPGLGTGNTTGGFTYPANAFSHYDGNDNATTKGTWGATPAWNADPTPDGTTGLVGPNHVVRIQSLTASNTVTTGTETDYKAHMWGAHIDDNVYGTSGWVGINPLNGTASTGDTPATLGTVNHIDYSTTTNLCMMCHGDLGYLVGTLWSGHNVVNGGTEEATADIFTPDMAIHQHYMYKVQSGGWASPTAAGDVGYSGDLSRDNATYGSGSYYDWSVDLTKHSDGGLTIGTQAEAAALSGNTVTGSGKQKFHKFTCSKCHSPHASINARLMITNCMNRDGTPGLVPDTNETFNEREGGPIQGGPVDDLVVGTQAATTLKNIRDVSYPHPQVDSRDIANNWQTDPAFNGQARAVQCHNNMASGDRSTYWQAIQ